MTRVPSAAVLDIVRSAVADVSLVTERLATVMLASDALLSRTVNAVAPVNPEPVMVTVTVVPCVPVDGETAAIAGASWTLTALRTLLSTTSAWENAALRRVWTFLSTVVGDAIATLIDFVTADGAMTVTVAFALAKRSSRCVAVTVTRDIPTRAPSRASGAV